MGRLKIEFASRGYELDFDGFVPPHVLLRYMEHLRWENVRRNSSGSESITRSDRAFVVAAQTIRSAVDIGMAVPMRGTVWIGRTGRTSMDFYHAFHRISDGILLAEGSTTIVYLGENGVPTPLPGRVRLNACDPAETVDLKPPEWTQMPAQHFKCSYRVRSADLDFLQHMNQANYAALYEDTRHAAVADKYYGPNGFGKGRIRLMHIEYAHSALPGDRLTVGTWLARISPLTLGFEMYRGDTLVSRAEALLR